MGERKPIRILMADDDEDDRELCRDAIEESRVLNIVDFVTDGIELLDYLHNRGEYQDKSVYPRPDLILLDLNMPRMDGREALKEIKLDSELRRIPVVILTTSKAEEDLLSGYDLGAASYITKPVTFTELVKLMKAMGNYWVEFVTLPGQGR